MRVARFGWRLLYPWLTPFLLIPLLVAWLVLAIILAVWEAWVESG